jgi:hypothetical protein
MRPSLLPGLLTAAQRNADKGYGDVAIFEVSGTYENDRTRRPAPRGRRCAPRHGVAQRRRSPLVECRQGRRQAGRCLRRQGRCARRDRGLRPADGQCPDRAGCARPGTTPAVPERSRWARRSCSAISASSIRRHSARSTSPARCAASRSIIDAMPEPKKKATRTKPALELSPFQAVKRDFAFVVDKHGGGGCHHPAATSADRKLITGVNVFDVFEGFARRGQEVRRHRSRHPAGRQDADGRGLRGADGQDRRQCREEHGRHAARLVRALGIATPASCRRSHRPQPGRPGHRCSSPRAGSRAEPAKPSKAA